MKTDNNMNIHIEPEVINDKDSYKLTISKNYFDYHNSVALVDALIVDLQGVLNNLEEFKYKRINNKDLDIGR